MNDVPADGAGTPAVEAASPPTAEGPAAGLSGLNTPAPAASSTPASAASTEAPAPSPSPSTEDAPAEDEDGAAIDGDDAWGDDDDEGDEEDPLSPTNLAKLIVTTKEFLGPLQDLGKFNDKKSEMQYPKLRKLALALYNKWDKTGLIALPNKSRTADKLVGIMLIMRKHMDIVHVRPELRPFAASPTDEKMFVLANDELGGQRVLVTAAVAKYGTKKKDQDGNRNPSIAIRVVYVLCHASLRAAAKYWLKNKKERGDLDQSFPTHLAFAEDALKLFGDKELKIARPDMMDQPDHDPERQFDPENCKFEGRSAEWLLETWEKYIKPKYKHVIGKWHKDTGGGGRKLTDFIKYCTLRNGTTLRWLPWIYAIDVASNFILYSVVKGQPSEFIRKEAGFEDADVPAGSTEPYKTPAKRKADELGEMIEAGHARIDRLVGIIEEKVVASTANPIHDRLSKMSNVSTSIAGIADDEHLTPGTKEELKNALVTEKRDLAKEIIAIRKETSKNEVPEEDTE